MRALVEASAAFDQVAGIGRYSRNILRSVIAELPGWDWRLLHAPVARSPAVDPDGWLGRARVSTVRIPVSRRRADQIWFRARVPIDIQMLTGRLDLVYSPDFTAPPAIRVPRIVTVHDLAFLTHPEHTTRALQTYLAAVVPKQVARADIVAVVSEATGRDVSELLDVPDDRVVVIRNGIEQRFFGAPRLNARDRDVLGIPEHFLLMVGTIEPRKNHMNVLRALSTLRSSDRLPVVIAGRPGWGYEATLARAQQMEADGLVHVVEYVPEPVLPSVYASAVAVLYPSWTEGFGLPILEAFAAGTPVITGTAPALREVAGDLATFVDPGQPDQIGDAIASHVAGRPFGDKARRVERARLFGWDEPARRLAEVMGEVSRRR